MLSGGEKALLAILLFVLMLGMGATLDRKQFGAVLRSPKGLLIGLASQFGWMPLVAYGLGSALGLSGPAALSLLVVGTTPGGTTSNLFTYYSRADLPLSLSMTVVSTVCAVVMMPLLLVAYAGGIDAGELAVPTKDIVSTLVIMLVPLAVGMLIRAKRPGWAPGVEKAGSWSGIGVLGLLIATGLLKNHELFLGIPWQGFVAAIGLGSVGMGLGYLVAKVARLGEASRRAVALETGIQNSPLALGVIGLSFPEAVQVEMMTLPLLYALFVLMSAGAVTLGWRRGGVENVGERVAA